jgi:hypothetical protein
MLTHPAVSVHPFTRFPDQSANEALLLVAD